MKPLRVWRETSLRFFSNRIFWRLTGPYIKVLQRLCHWSHHSKAALFITWYLQRCYNLWQSIFAHISLFVFQQHKTLPHIITCYMLTFFFFFLNLCCQMTSSWWGGACGRWSSRWWRLTPALTASLPQTLSCTVRESQSKERSVRDSWASGPLTELVSGRATC